MKSLKVTLFFISLAIILLTACKPRFEKEILVSEVEDHIGFLASDSLKGRYPGTPEDSILAEYITRQMKRAGLVLWNKTGKQDFPIVTSIHKGENNALKFNDSVYSPGIDFQPMPFSSNGEVSAEVVFAGYGFNFRNDSMSWNDYSQTDVNGKIVMILLGNPDPENSRSAYVNYSQDRGKVLVAQDMGAVGVILVAGEHYDPSDELTSLKSKEHQLGIPAIQVKRDVADQILKKSGQISVNALEAQVNSTLTSSSFNTMQSATVSTDIVPEQLKTFNAIAMLSGSVPALRGQYVVIGAHHDHLGMGGAGSSSRRPDTTSAHYGADDNASGVAGVLEISEKLVTMSPQRSIMFATFGAEEMGIVGSRYMVEHSPVEIDSIQAMINLDMVGRLSEDRQLQINGIGTSPVFQSLLDSINVDYGFKLKYSSEGFGPSDHASFYAADVPVLFITTGAHSDYHTPGDSFDKINYEGAVEVFSFAADIAEALANYASKIEYTEAGPKVRASSRGRYGKITLGIMPDMNYDGGDGMPVLAVYEGRPAASGGMKKGDIITAIEGKSVGNIYDYMSRLGELEAGQSIIVSVKRNGDEMDLLIQL